MLHDTQHAAKIYVKICNIFNGTNFSAIMIGKENSKSVIQLRMKPASKAIRCSVWSSEMNLNGPSEKSSPQDAVLLQMVIRFFFRL